ncbi:hypothetical protein ACOYR1_12690 [Thalassotalea piscium]
MKIKLHNQPSFKVILSYAGLLFVIHVAIGGVLAEFSNRSIIDMNINDSGYFLTEYVLSFLTTVVFFYLFGRTYQSKPYKEALKIIVVLLFFSIGLSLFIIGKLEIILFIIDVFTTFIAMLLGVFLGIKVFGIRIKEGDGDTVVVK